MGVGTIKPRGQIKQNTAFGQIGIFKLVNHLQRNMIQGQQYGLETIRVIQSQQVFNQWYISSLKILDDQQSKLYILFPIHHYFTNAGACGQVKQVNIVFQNFQYVLSTEIQERSRKKTRFTQQQMWYMLSLFIQTGSIFQLRKRNKMGNFHPSKIVINQHGHLKFVSMFSLPDQTTNFQRLSQNTLTKDVYLAPQQFNKSDLKKGIYPIEVDPCKADVFSIGMTLLSAALLIDCSDLYNQSKQGLWFVSGQQLKSKIASLGNFYSGLLIQYIKFMLEFDPTSRKKCSQIENQLKPYKNDIMQLRPFGYRQSNQLSKAQNNSYVNSQISHNSFIAKSSFLSKNIGKQQSKSQLKNLVSGRTSNLNKQQTIKKTNSYANSQYF